MRVTIDIADTPTGPAPVEIRVPEQALGLPTSPVDIAGSAIPTETQPYDGGAEMAVPVLAQPNTETATLAPPAPPPGAAHDGGAAPPTASAGHDQLLPAQIEAPARLEGETKAR
jgi:hypothetical protein